MKFKSAMMIAIATAISTAPLFSQTAINLQMKNIGRAEVKDGTYIISQKHTYLQSAPFQIKADKTYSLSATIRACQTTGQDKSLVYLSFLSDDAKGTPIQCWHNMNVPGTFTVVTADAKKGDLKLKVKDGSKMKTSTWLCLVMNAKEDFSDIPNRTRLAGNITANVQMDGFWELTLAQPLLSDIKAGAAIRQHSFGGYLYPIGSKQVGQEWVTYTASIKNILPGAGWHNCKWPKGSVKGKVIILPNWSSKKLVTEIKDIRLIEQ